MSNPSGSGSGSGWGYRGIGLSNTIHSDVAPCLPLPSLPLFCGASDPELRLFDEPSSVSGRAERSADRSEILSLSSKIADLLRDTDVSYLNLKDDAREASSGYVEPLALHEEVLRYNPEAFEYSIPGHTKEPISSSSVHEKKPYENSVLLANQAQRELYDTRSHRHHHVPPSDVSTSSKKPKVKKKLHDEIPSSVTVDPVEHQDDVIGRFCEVLEDLCGRAEIAGDDRGESEWLALPISDLRILVNEIVSIRAKKLLHLVPVNILIRLLRVLDHQIHRAEGLSIDEMDHSDSDAFSSILCALESIHASLAVMSHNQMPKQLYSEEIIERILEFARHQITDIMCIFDPSYRALHKPGENGAAGGYEDEDPDGDFGSAKKRRTVKSFKMKKSTVNKVSAAANTVLQKLCTILGLLKDLLLIEKLSDSCILQLVRTSFTTLLVDNVQLLQLKAIALMSAIFYSYKQHRTYLVDEMIQLLWKLPSSKRALRAYLLPDEDQRQIQMITALLIQLVHCSANLPEGLREASSINAILEVPVDAIYLTKCHEAVTEACCLFWTRVLQRLTSVKAQDASEVKVMMENLVMDLMTTLNLPEYPASAPILEVFCVLLLQNAGLKSKDVSARSMAIDFLGTIAARLKRDAVIHKLDNFWMVQELNNQEDLAKSYQNDLCSICSDGRLEKLLFTCQSCQRSFHSDCMGVKELEVPSHSWNCQFCICRKQLMVLQSYCKSQSKENQKNRNSEEKSFGPITKVEIVQQLLLNYLQESGAVEDIHFFVRWFYLCLWYKDDPKSQQKFYYYLARLRAKTIVRDSGTVYSSLTRDSVKKITLALGQFNSFSRGFDKILHVLLASLRENSPVIRAKALRAVSIIVEADPEVLRDRRVQLAVEGRFCDSAISVREAALELVGRHIASHPDVGLQYFEKVAERIKDTGVSVRKRSIKIIRDMCTSTDNFAQFTSACIEIIVRVTDDESSIQDLVCKTFYEFWFEETPGSHTQFYSDGSSVPLEVAKKTEQIVDMLRRMPHHQLLVAVIKRNLALDFFPQSTKAAGINPVLLASVRRHCELMCKCLLEKILQVDESTAGEMEVRILPYVLALHAFCVADPTLCAPASDPSQFVVTLQTYLKIQGESRAVAQLLESIIFIIDAVLPLLRKLPQSLIEELEQDLKNMIVQNTFLTVVHACIKCLCSVSKIAGKASGVVEYLVQVFFKTLESQGVENKQKLGKSLFCLGLLIRYGNALLCTSSDKRVDVAKSLSLFRRYLDMDDFILKVRSLQGLGFVLIARPDFMLDKEVGKILEVTLSSRTDHRLKVQALQNVYEYLLDAESQLGSENGGDSTAHYPAENNQSVPVAAGAGDTNICGGIVQLYWDKILGRCIDFNEQVRQTALKIVEVVLRQGLVHPITCVPYLIALETDPQEANSKLAHHLLMNMNEKYPAFFESRLGDGLQMSFIFIEVLNGENSGAVNQTPIRVPSNVKGKSDSGSLAQARLGVSRIYKLIRGNRVSRNKFMSSIIRKFDSPSWNESVIPFLMYCTEILALLPFTTPDEPLYLVYAINRVIQVRAGAIEANLKAFCSRWFPREGLYMPPENETVQQEAITRLNFGAVDLNGTIYEDLSFQPSYGQHMRPLDLNGRIPTNFEGNHAIGFEAKAHPVGPAEPCEISKNDLQGIQEVCLAALALQLLLKLKRHLKIIYTLNDARCQAFSPTEPLKAGEPLSKQNILFSISEVRRDLPLTPQDILQRYQEFKNALREDTIDYAVYTANIKVKRPAPRRGSRRTMAADDVDDENDDDWTGSGRVSARRSSYRTRQR